MRKYILAALVTSALATPAMAQDRGPFTGIRVEGLAGWDRPKSGGVHDNGIVYGVGAGFDFQTGGAVMGVEGEATDSTADKCVNGLAVSGDRACAAAGRDLYVGGRVGGLVSPDTLIYAKAGYTNSRVHSTYVAAPGGTGSFNVRENLDGLRVGGGVEHAVGRNAFVKAEYRYSNYEQDTTRHQVVAGFGFRF